jgi:hypothetical protein
MEMLTKIEHSEARSEAVRFQVILLLRYKMTWNISAIPSVLGIKQQG